MDNEKKKLHRSKDDRWLAGVCGGLAEYFDVDGTLIRVLFILFGFAVGGGILIYIILWIIMPDAPDGDVDAKGDQDFELEEFDAAAEVEVESVEQEAPAEAEAPAEEADEE